MKRYLTRKQHLAARAVAGGRSGNIARLPEENPNPVLRVTCDGMLLYRNPAAAALLDRWGCRAGQLPSAVLPELARALESDERRELEVPLGERTLLAVLAPFRAKGYVNLYFTDITERKLVEVELRSLLDRLDSLVHERTAEIQSKNARLIIEIEERKRAEEALHSYARRLIELEEEMRRKLAAELHDEFGRDLTALGLNFTIINNSLPEESREKLGERLDDTASLIEELSQSIRQIMFMLRPPVLDDFGLAAALHWHADLFGKRTGLRIDFQAEETVPRLSEHVETALFRIAHEALTNVAKHADATRVSIRLAGDSDRVEMTIIDDGRGFTPTTVATAHPGGGWGLTIMRERAEAVGARFQIRSAPEAGSAIVVTVQEAA